MIYLQVTLAETIHEISCKSPWEFQLRRVVPTYSRCARVRVWRFYLSSTVPDLAGTTIEILQK